MPIPTFKFNKLTRTDLLQFDGVNFVNVPVYAVGKNVEWGTEGVGYNSLTVGNITKSIPLINHKHTTNDILGLKELINDLGVNSSTDLSKYLLTSSFIDHLNNFNSAKHVTQAHLDKLNSLDSYWQLDEQGNLYTTYNTYSTQELSAWKNGDYSGFTFSLGTATDIELSGLATDDLLKYNGTKWVNVPMSSLVTGGGDGSVTSVGLSVPTGLYVTGSPITSSGTLAISFASGYSIPTTTKQSNWDSAYNHSWATGNPHGVTKSQVGLGSVNNTADSAKNVLSATKLTTTRTIWGQNFNGTGNVSGAITGASTISASSTVTASSFISTATSGFMLTGAKSTWANAIGTASGGGIALVTNGLTLTQANTQVYLAANGNTRIGRNATNPTTALMVAGTAYATGEVTAFQSSDIRLKHTINPITSALDTLDKLRPVSFFWNEKANDLNPFKGYKEDYGLIAQEVENILPNIVHTVYDKYKGIDYIKLVPIMISAIKELKEKIDKYEENN